MNYVYLSGPMGGCSFEEMSTWRDYTAKQLNSTTVKCLLPTRSYEDGVKPNETSKWINRRDYFDCTRASCILVNFLNMTSISIGTVMEIAWAFQSQIPIILVAEPGGVQNHPMLNDAITREVTSLEDGIAAVKEVLSEAV